MKRFLAYSFFQVLILCLVTVAQTYGQSGDRILITGKIIDSKDKSAIIGATVIEQDRDKRTISGITTDIDGNFALRITNPANRLVISYLGYATQTLNIGTRRQFANIQLVSTAQQLTDVVIVGSKLSDNGTGLNIDRRDQTTTTVTISAKDIENLQATSIDQAIQGRLPGIDIVSNSGDPGAGMSIKIRGASTLNGDSNPLIVLDGVPYETSVPPNFNFAVADQNEYADLLSIAPTDIKDISILKDAAATAVWGSRAANGVLVINTKRGTKAAPTITYTFKGSLQQQPGMIPLLTGDQYSTFIPEMVMNVNGYPLNTSSVRELAYNPYDVYYYNNYGQNTNWVEALSRTGSTFDNTLAITGGGEKAFYYASVAYNDQIGTTIGTGFKRLTTRLNLDYNVSEKLRFTTNISYTHSSRDMNYSTAKSDGSGRDNVRAIAAIRAPNTSIFEYNDLGVLTPNYLSPASNIQGQYPNAFNPVAMAYEAVNNRLEDRVRPQFNLRYRISEAFTASQDVVFDITNGKHNQFVPQIATGRPFTESTVNRANSSDYDSYNVTTKTDFIYTPQLNDKHSFTGLISLQSYDTRGISQGQSLTNTASTALQDPSVLGFVTGISSGSDQTRSVAGLINGQYKYLDRYIINVALRGDGHSRFGKDNRYGIFPAVSARYRLSGEPFMQKYSSWLDDFSFRGSYGVSGRAPRYDYMFYGRYASAPATYLGLSGLYPSTMQLNNLKWESLHGVDGGFTMVLFKNRLNVDLGFYRNLTKDLFSYDLALPSTSGYSNVDLNVGELENKGMELSIFSTPYKSKNWLVNFNFNISNNINTVKSISPFFNTQAGNVTQNSQYLSLLQVNNPLGSFYGYKFKGVYSDAASTRARDANGNVILSPDGTPVQMRFNYPQTDYVFEAGDAMYEDINHDGNINYQDVVYLGNSYPKFTGGFGPSVTFKGRLTLQAFFNYRLGGDVVNRTEMLTTNMFGYNNQSSAVLRRWRREGDVTDMPRALFNRGFNWLGSDRYVEDSSFLRLSSMTVNYTFDKALAKRLKAKNLGFYVTAQNLLTFTRYTGQDPEVSVRGNDMFAIAEDNSTTPPLKMLTFGLNASF